MSDHHDSAIPCPSAEVLFSRLARICSLRVEQPLGYNVLHGISGYYPFSHPDHIADHDE